MILLFFYITNIQSNILQRISYSDLSEDTYINKIFTGVLPCAINNHIQLGLSNKIKQISGCRFTDINISSRVFIIEVVDDSSILDNIFERTTHQSEKWGCILYNYNSSNKFIIKNCKFIRIVGKGDEYSFSVFKSNIHTLAHIEFKFCEFIDCGEKGSNRPIVSILQQNSTIEFYKCNFSYKNPQKSRVLELKGNGATFDNCNFDNCGTNCIDIGIEHISTSFKGVFQFTNNFVNSVNTRFLNAPRILAKPNISNNIFKNITLNDDCLFYISHDQAEIEMINNTFIDILYQGEKESNFGGFPAFVERNDSNFKIIYGDCHFYDIVNEHKKNPSNKGAAIHYFSNGCSIADFEIINCKFKRNHIFTEGQFLFVVQEVF